MLSLSKTWTSMKRWMMVVRTRLHYGERVQTLSFGLSTNGLLTRLGTFNLKTAKVSSVLPWVVAGVLL